MRKAKRNSQNGDEEKSQGINYGATAWRAASPDWTVYRKLSSLDERKKMEETDLCDVSDCTERSIMLAPSECLGAEPGTGKQKIKQMEKKKSENT